MSRSRFRLPAVLLDYHHDFLQSERLDKIVLSSLRCLGFSRLENGDGTMDKNGDKIGEFRTLAKLVTIGGRRSYQSRQMSSIVKRVVGFWALAL